MLTIKKLSIVIISIALLSFNTFAQTVKTETKLNPFTAIEVSNDFEVTVIAGTEYFVELNVDKTYSEFIRTTVKGSTLSISLDDKKVPTDIKKFFTGKTEGIFKAIVSTPGNIEGIYLKGHSILTLNQDLLSKDAVTVELTDNSTLKSISIKADKVTLTLSKKATATVDSESDILNINTSGSSSLKLTQISHQLNTDIQGNSELSIAGETETLHYEAKGTAKCEINGKAESAEFNCAGSSNTDAAGLMLKTADVKMNSICVLKEAASEKVTVDISGGASLIFDNNPVTEIINIKSSSMSRYERGK